MLNIKTVVCGLCALVLLSGCANQNRQMQREAVMERNQAFSVDKISFADDMDVLVSDLKVFKENNLLKIMVEFMNADDGKNRNFVYKVEWYDQYGMLRDSTSWRPKQVIGNQKVKVVESATLPNVVDYKLVISTKE